MCRHVNLYGTRRYQSLFACTHYKAFHFGKSDLSEVLFFFLFVLDYLFIFTSCLSHSHVHFSYLSFCHLRDFKRSIAAPES